MTGHGRDAERVEGPGPGQGEVLALHERCTVSICEH